MHFAFCTTFKGERHCVKRGGFLLPSKCVAGNNMDELFLWSPVGQMHFLCLSNGWITKSFLSGKKCVSEHIIKEGGSVVVWRRKRGPGWLAVWWACCCCSLCSAAFSPLCSAVPLAAAAAECQTVHYWWCQGGPSPPPSPGKQHDRRPKSGAYLRGRGGGGTSTLQPTSKLLELQQWQRVRPGLVGGGGTRLRGGTALRCHSPRQLMSMLDLFKSKIWFKFDEFKLDLNIS